MSRVRCGRFTDTQRCTCMYTPTHTQVCLSHCYHPMHEKTHTENPELHPHLTDAHTHTHSSFPSTFARNTISPFFSVCGQPVRRKCQINELKHEEETFQTQQMETVSYYYTMPHNTAATAACGY